MKIQIESVLDKLDKGKLELDGLSVYLERYNREPKPTLLLDPKVYNLNEIQTICLTTILQGKDLLCRSVCIKEKGDQPGHLPNTHNERIITWLLAIASKVLEKKRVLVVVPFRDIGEAIKKQLGELLRATTCRISTIFNNFEEVEETFDVLIGTPNYVYQFLTKKKFTTFDLLVVDECNKFNDPTFFRIITDIKQQIGPSLQVAVFSPLFSRDNFSLCMREDRVVVEVESLGNIKLEPVLKGRETPVGLLKKGKYVFKGSWRDEVEIDKILIVVREYDTVEESLTQARIPFRTTKPPKGKQEDFVYRDAIIEKFKAGAFPVLVVDRFCKSLSLNGLSLVISFDYSDNIRDLLLRSTYLKKGGKLVTFISEDSYGRFLEMFIGTLEINKVEIPDWLFRLKGRRKPKGRDVQRDRRGDSREGPRGDIVEDLEKMTLEGDKDLSDDEELNVWG